MNKYLEILTKKIFELYDVYDSYAFASYIKGENKYKLIIKYEEKNTLHFLMLEKNINNEYELADEVHINFEDERNLYEAISLRLFSKVLGNVMIHKANDNTYYNTKHKGYILLIAEDKEIKELIDKIIINQESECINLEHKMITDASKKTKTKKIDWEFLSSLEDRTELTKEIFRRW